MRNSYKINRLQYGFDCTYWGFWLVFFLFSFCVNLKDLSIIGHHSKLYDFIIEIWIALNTLWISNRFYNLIKTKQKYGTFERFNRFCKVLLIVALSLWSLITLTGAISILISFFNQTSISFEYPVLLLFFIPMLMLEYTGYAIKLGNTRKLFLASFVSGLVGILIAYPLSWLIRLGIELLAFKTDKVIPLQIFLQKTYFVLFSSAWIPLYEVDKLWNNIVAEQLIIGWIVWLLVAVAIKYFAIKKWFYKDNFLFTKNLVWKANMLSYSLVILIYGISIFLS